jgi:hypothetical protein
MELAATIATGVIVALATAFFTSRFYVHQATVDLQREFDRRFNDRRWDIYTEFSKLLIDLLQASTDDRVQKQMPKFIQRMREFIGRLWLVGSDDVVKAVLRWRRYTQSVEDGSAEANTQAIVELLNILVAMRRDLGERDTELSARDILATFVNDVDSYVDEKGHALPRRPG